MRAAEVPWQEMHSSSMSVLTTNLLSPPFSDCEYRQAGRRAVCPSQAASSRRRRSLPRPQDVQLQAPSTLYQGMKQLTIMRRLQIRIRIRRLEASQSGRCARTRSVRPG